MRIAMMDKTEFKNLRTRLNKTQKQMAQLLGTSLKAIHSYEQGWRTIPPAVERQIYFLVSRINRSGKRGAPCWKIKNCPPDQKKQCPAWEFKSGDLCWFINGTICDGIPHKNWNDKMKVCRSCKVFASNF
jgi:DNA-binding XRE family transcriptional regulator